MVSQSKAEARRRDPRTTEELIHTALTAQDEEGDWEAISVLWSRGTREVFEAARHLCRSESAIERDLGVTILGQLKAAEEAVAEDTLTVLLEVLEHEKHTSVLSSTAIALGHRQDPRSIRPLARLKSHFSPQVRYGVVHGLMRHEDDLAIGTLIDLTEDSDDDVRDWATFGLGTLIDTDSPQICDVLLRRAMDEDDDTRAEAIVGLARKGDTRVVEPLHKELALLRNVCSGRYPAMLIFEAAGEIGDPRLIPVLQELKEIWDWEDIDEAISRCRVKAADTDANERH
jgi:HEAT repeat protein